MKIDNEVFVRCHRVEADLVLNDSVRNARQMIGEKSFELLLIAHSQSTVHAKRIDDRFATGVTGDLHPPIMGVGKTVNDLARGLEQKSGTAPVGPIASIVVGKPKLRFAANFEREFQIVQQFLGPGTGGQNQTIGRVNIPVGLNNNAVAFSPPIDDHFARHEFRAEFFGGRPMGMYAAFDVQKASAAFENALPSVVHLKAGKPLANFR